MSQLLKVMHKGLLRLRLLLQLQQTESDQEPQATASLLTLQPGDGGTTALGASVLRRCGLL